MKNLVLFSCVIAMMTMLVGCTVPVEQKAALVRMGTMTTTATGLVAVPDQDEAKAIAEEAKKYINDTAIPLVTGDEKALGNVLDIIVEQMKKVKKLEKFAVIAEASLPLLKSQIPDDLIESGQKKLSDEALQYIQAFLFGLRDGVDTYLGAQRGEAPLDCTKMRESLSAPASK